MKKYNLFISLIGLSLVASSANGKTIDKHKLSFVNDNCKKTDSCNLKKMELTIFRATDTVPGAFGKRINARTSMEGYYETSKIEDVEQYAIVQFIKGGIFSLHSYDKEATELHRNTSRTFFGKYYAPFIHPKWVVDSFDNDPIYASYAEENARHGLYRIKKDEAFSVLFDDSSNFEYYFNKPSLKVPRMHFSDMPTGGNYSEVKISAGENAGKTLKVATNASMAFKTCIYKTKDAPADAGANGISLDKAIGCLEWSNHQIYNSKKNEFETSKSIDPRALLKN